MHVTIRQAVPQDAESVAAVLGEAARWLEQRGMKLWRDDELLPTRIAPEIMAGLFFLAECDGEIAGTIKFQLEDPLFWPDVPAEESAFIHRVAVRRRFAGGGVSTALLQWAISRTRSLGRRYLRLDCDAARPRLRAVYERFGFTYHSDRQVGPYLVARYEYDVTLPAVEEFTIIAVVDLLHVLESTGITVWLDGGWGIDALLQTQTRLHKDLDLIPRVDDVPRLLELLAPCGFTVRRGTPPHAFVLANAAGLEIDIHAVSFNDQGQGIHRMEEGGDWIFPSEAFTGRGRIASLNVCCLSPAAQVLTHAQGYTPTEKDLRDMELLQWRFNLVLPPSLQRDL